MTISPLAANADLHSDVFIGPFLPFEQGPGTFAATTSTLVTGPSEARSDRCTTHSYRRGRAGRVHRTYG